jgi:hypothetical protein
MRMRVEVNEHAEYHSRGAASEGSPAFQGRGLSNMTTFASRHDVTRWRLGPQTQAVNDLATLNRPYGTKRVRS